MFRNFLNDGRSCSRVARPSIVVALSLILSALFLPAQAQATPAKSAPTDPSDPQASVPAVRYASALSRYRPLQEAPAASWQEANERANRVGGWRVYAREKAASDDAPSTATPPAAQGQKPAPAAESRKGHEGHAPR